ncbi:MAG TPA: DNA replication/repair protein RecF [Gammaproteobacteria bacterium]|nr:DNA replication/repair protein RecF [Gammaproteobacteria bacterium]
MGLSSLSLRNFRCFAAADLEFAPTLNLINGENASGKTSLIESIFLLGRGRSFKTANLEATVRMGSRGFQITGQVSSLAASLNIGLVRENGQLQAKIAGKPPATIAQLSETFPVQLVDSQAHQLIRGGPRRRRQFLDWGVFHVEPAFFPAWRRYQRALHQRNTLLRRGKSQQEIASWDGELIFQGEALDRFRQEYLASLLPTAANWAGQALGGLVISLEYRSGWPESLRFSEALQDAIERDRYAGMTQVGPHRAEMLIKVDGKAAQEWVSSGQEKALVGSLLLAQAAVYRILTGRPCTLLLDDLAAELDAGHLARFLDRVEETGAQTHITAIDLPSLIMERAAKVFHVKQGKID